MEAVKAGGARLLPIDSEHSAIFQSLPEDYSSWDARVEKIILTASGGPFRTLDPARLRDVTPEQACAHPNWVMGRKISVDSATMMNKAMVAPFPHPSDVPITIPTTSPMAQPARQCSVAMRATALSD